MQKINHVSALFGATPILIGSQLAIATAAIFAKFALGGAGAVMVAALRLSIAASILLVMNARTKQKPEICRSHECLFALCGFGLAVHFAAWIASLSLTSVAIATLLVSTAPFWTTLYDVVVLRRKPSIQFWLGFVATVIGSLIAVASGLEHGFTHTASQQKLGAILSLIGGSAFGFYLIAVRNISDNYPTLLIVSRTYAWSAVFLWLGVFLFHEHLPAANSTCWTGIFGMAIFSQLLGHTGMNQSLKRFSSNIVALSTLLEPIFAAVLAMLIFHESLSKEMIIGALLIVAGLTSVMSAKF